MEGSPTHTSSPKVESITSTKHPVSPPERIVLAVQLGATLVILAVDAPSALKLGALIVIWAVTFGRLSRRELVCFLGVSILFSIMDVLAVRQGLFAFSHGDIAGLPLWEYVMWGFYVLHMLRMVDGPAPPQNLRLVVPLAILFAIPFATLTDPTSLFISSAVVLIVVLFFFHEALDWRYVAYAVVVGAAVEYVGVWSGQWQYPRHPIGGVEVWFCTMWGGIGLFTRRLLLPLVAETRETPSRR